MTFLAAQSGRILLGTLVLLGGGGAILAAPVSAHSPNGWVLSAGSRVAGVEVGGLSPEAATEAVANKFEAYREQRWVLEVGDQTLEVTPATLGISAEFAKLQEALELAQPAPKTTFDRLVRWIAPPEPTVLELQLVLDQPTFDAWITTVRPTLEHPATDARLDWEQRQVIVERQGQSFDKGAWQGLVDDPLTEFSPRHLELPVTTIAPKVLSSELAKIQFETPFAEFTTKFDIRKANRSHNIRTAVAKWQGVVLPAHATISFNETVGKRTAENGFKSAPVYENRRVSEGFGGGICQVSTTLYNTALVAGMTIEQRGGHSRPCDYAPPGRDSTVDWPSRDLKFTNPYDFPLYIDADTDGGTVTFRFYGDVAHQPKIVLNEDVTYTGGPGDPEYIVDTSLPPGTKRTLDAGFGGRRVVVTRIWDPGTPQERKEVVSTDRLSALRAIVAYNPGPEGLVPEGANPPGPANPEGEVPHEPTPEPAEPMPF